MFRIARPLLVTKRVPVLRRRVITISNILHTARLGMAFGWKKQLPPKEGLKCGDEPASLAYSGFPNPNAPVETGLTSRILRLETRITKTALATEEIKGNVKTMKLQSGILLVAIVGMGGAVLALFVKEELSGNPNLDEIEKMIRGASE